ncbi:hypothetical protein [Marinimicrobium agarilyticum]|uniref:hypothetical protein n=1 Tax=Marinimicrobium agarilyticum TaxID=306546 RepID=UPI000417B0EB|nr:hypothetical protein [Marinimicrobium agarilyticum]
MQPIKWWRAWRARKKKGPPDIADPAVPEALQRDAGVEVIRIRLPSGAEVQIVKRHPRE